MDVGELTDYEILDTINNKNLSTVFMREKNFTTMLSGIRFANDANRIVSFEMILIHFSSFYELIIDLKNILPY